jgi:uncharacterized membrane protein
MATAILKHTDSGLTKEVPVGISITVILLGFIIPLIRGDIKGAIIGVIFAFFMWIPGNIIFAIIYNKMYIKDLLEKGYRPASETDRTILMSKGIVC